ncbi:tripartite tricarboxylate transporter substrate binding protein [Corynebacterium cystitidis]|uniref:Putative tricarboxylic transport membrane protein n=1 Tax=Corynebacterium cystitidis DSM 20524 TaxID=1121357 RepID=A0A1H9S812_9CORY|nr:tripartite tricarboxylate transporter substrate-binding protein [Corynebacterium cystitidis]WJY82250.1 Tripartite tricarboxylate transporter family receptor [Corynebacterium cystitidis DSM 20524]SER81137.1 putative tricarboxylic transport membrane protein [Corynebacterium cystitidis DSM 20524]SNV77291.1 citrate uptake transporter, substrate binding protein [Corynebacterium cystitidis]
MRKAVDSALVIVAVILSVIAIALSVQGSGESVARSSLTIVAGAATGGGWDTTARSIQEVARGQGIVNNVQVVNIPGAGGTIALENLVQKWGSENILLITGGGMIASAEIAQPGASIADVTPIARLAEEYSVFAVPADSPYQSMEEFVADWIKDPRSVAVGGAAIGNTDHLLVSRSAMALGMDPKGLKYIPFEGGGEMLNAMLSKSIDVGVTGYRDIQDQVEAGTLRVLAISSGERVEGLDVPTLQEAGVDIVATNWRGVVAPPGISEEATQELIDILFEVQQTPEWAEIAERNSWEQTFVSGDDFVQFVKQERENAIVTVEALEL